MTDYLKKFIIVTDNYDGFGFYTITEVKKFIKKENIKSFSIFYKNIMCATIKNNEITYCHNLNILDIKKSKTGKYLNQVKNLLSQYAKINTNKALINVYYNHYIKKITFCDEVGNAYTRTILKDDKANKKALIKFNNKLVTINY